MPKLSVWNEGKHNNDFKFIDKNITDYFTIGGTEAFIHKYKGPANTGPSIDPSQPQYTNQSEKNIQDLLFLENRDRIYDSSIYSMRCIYTVADTDFNLSQFGIMIQNGVLFITFHLKDMVENLGRKLLSGDVIELPHLKDYYALDETVPVALKRFYVVQDADRSAAGFGPTWWPHLWRVKCTPLVDTQEFKSILSTIVTSNNGNIENISSTYITDLFNNQAVVESAEQNVPESGYDTNPLWSQLFEVKNGKIDVNKPLPLDTSPETKFSGYLVNNGTALDGYPVTAATTFPTDAEVGQYILRTDFMPNRLFRYSGKKWIVVSDALRTSLTNGAGKTQRDTFINDNSTFIDSNGNVQPSLQNLNNIGRIPGLE